MTLKEFATKYNRPVTWTYKSLDEKEIPRVYMIDFIGDDRSELWHLSDYKVSAVMASTIWFSRR